LDVISHDTAQEFLDRAGPLLAADEPRHNLHLGVVSTLVDAPHVYPEFHLWTVRDRDRTVLAALLTPPFNLLVSQPAADVAIEAMDALAATLQLGGVAVPGVTAAVPEVDLFVEAWQARTGAVAEARMRQRIYALTEVTPVGRVSGRMRPATDGDRELLVRWLVDFSTEALPGDERFDTERIVDLRLSGQAGGRTGIFLWEDGEPAAPVALVGFGGFTPNGARIGPVYTPPDFRRRGYASALTAGVSAWLLQRGRRFCFLYTDLSNPTSNDVYASVGYRPVCDSRDDRFVESSA
jgi:predicted GNAT family acetyltransferase